jgi:hypothetical protein
MSGKSSVVVVDESASASKSTMPGPLNPAPVLALPQSRRRPMLTALGLLSILLCGAGVYWAVQVSSERVSVVGVARDVAYGQTITAQDLVQMEIPVDSGLSAVSWAQEQAVIGKRAAADLLAGSLVQQKAYTDGDLIPEGRALVGVTVKPNQSPTTELRPRDVVGVVVVQAENSTASGTASGEPEQIPAEVMAVGSVQSGGVRTVDVTVDADVAAKVAALSAAGRLALVFVSRG